jgi:hypothetical protein
MKKDPDDDPDMLPEYDFSNGIRGKYFDRVAGHYNLVRLEPDVAEVFTDSESVNKALRGLIPDIQEQAGKVQPR